MWKSAFVFVQTVEILFLLTLAVCAPIWLTPGHYWWSAFGVLTASATSGFTAKVIKHWSGME